MSDLVNRMLGTLIEQTRVNPNWLDNLKLGLGTVAVALLLLFALAFLARRA